MGKCCASLVGQMKRQVTIQNPVRASDGQGGFTETFPNGATVAASIEPVKGYEKFQAAQMQTPVSHKIVMRYRTDVTVASRLKYGDRIFEVKEAINVDEDSRFLAIRAMERT